MNTVETTAPPSKLLSYLRLFRLPNVFTAMSDIAMGFLFVNATVQPLVSFLGLLLASGLLYTAGMVLNDVFDLQVDQRERPRRPLPSGQISWSWARTLGLAMLLGGVGVAWGTGFMDPREGVIRWQSGAIATILAASVVSYDALLKKTFLGPLAMGACRFFNVLLGMSLGVQTTWGFDKIQLSIAAGIAIYIVGVTYFARTEATESNRASLAAATGVMVLGFLTLSYFPYAEESAPRLQFRSDFLWPMTVLLLVIPILRRCLTAVTNPTPQQVQATVKHCIFSLVMLDAAVILAVRGPTYAIAILLLSVPMYLLGKWVYST